MIARRPRLIAHCALEAYAVLTRLPMPHRAHPQIVADYLGETFAKAPLALGSTEIMTLVGDLNRFGISGGASYDGLVALTAKAHGATLISLDTRAAATYARCEVGYVLLG